MPTLPPPPPPAEYGMPLHGASDPDARHRLQGAVAQEPCQPALMALLPVGGEPVPASEADRPHYVRSGLGPGGTIEHLQGSVVVKGDVPEGAVVRASGDVVVLGQLRGEAHAGCAGDRAAEVVALGLDPRRVSIAGVPGPPDRRSAPGAPTCARLAADGTVVVGPGPGGGAAGAGVGAAAPGRARLTPAGRAAVFTGAYIAAVGLCALFAPAATFATLFRAAPQPLGWGRVLGVLAACFGAYYAGAAYGEARGWGARGFYWSTVAGRLFLVGAFGWLVATGRFAEPALLVLAAANLLGALSMCWALRREPGPRHDGRVRLRGG